MGSPPFTRLPRRPPRPLDRPRSAPVASVCLSRLQRVDHLAGFGVGRRQQGAVLGEDRLLLFVRPARPGRRLERAQLLERRLLDVAQPPGVVADRGLEHVAHVARVAERRPARRLAEHLAQPGDDGLVRVVVGALGHLLEDRDQLVVGVVLELDLRAEPALEAGVLGDEDRHRQRVAGDDHDQVVALVLHLLDQGVDGFLAVLVAGQRVGLVDEEHAALGLLDLVGGLLRGLAEVAGHQLRPVALDQLALRQQPERAVDPGHQPGDRGLPGAGVAVEDQVPGDRRASRARPSCAAPPPGARRPAGGSRP